MAGLGVEKLDKLMPDVVHTASKVDIASHVRDGYIMMFIYLPLTFGDRFTPYVGPIIPCILKVPSHRFSPYRLFIHAFDFRIVNGKGLNCAKLAGLF